MPEQPEPRPADHRPADHRPADARARLKKDFFSKPTRANVIIAIALAGVGFAAMTQVQSNERDDKYTGLRQDDLVRVLDGLSTNTQRAEREIDQLRSTQEKLRSSSSQRQAALEQARKDAQIYGILAGLVGAQGPGIRITIDDQAGEVRASLLLDTIQELRAAGAEAIEFNDSIRFIAQSSVAENSQGITVDGVLLTNPYVIDVIGEPRTLSDALVFPDGPTERVERVGGTLVATESDEIVIDSVVEEPEARFAHPDEGE
ncbi:DUF881 domain-containing protein [Nocardioides daejeonensis]|uniref:DUF881 domain-containing protein n=1 Tax=Nocardioides daejeonensis TaxID=1046556 RepID=UPI000D7446D7|nr:DUF881 domain-containing protein [Nocardioides daejeonensis]